MAWFQYAFGYGAGMATCGVIGLLLKINPIMNVATGVAILIVASLAYLHEQKERIMKITNEKIKNAE